MEFRNHTVWQTQELQELVHRAIDYRDVNPAEITEVQVDYLEPDEQVEFRGWSNIMNHRIWLYVPAPEDVNDFDEYGFVQMTLHEVDHVLGLEHEEMQQVERLDVPKYSDVTVRPR